MGRKLGAYRHLCVGRHHPDQRVGGCDSGLRLRKEESADGRVLIWNLHYEAPCDKGKHAPAHESGLACRVMSGGAPPSQPAAQVVQAIDGRGEYARYQEETVVVLVVELGLP